MKVTVNNDSYSIDLIQSANPAEDAVHALAAIIEEDLPQRLANAELMLDYGSVRRPADTLDAWHRVMQEPCNARLIDALHSALGLMKRAEPIQRGRVASAIANFTGAKLEAELKREIALCELERTLADATEAAEQVRAHIGKVDSLRQENKADRISLAAHIKAGSDHLARIAPARMAPPDENPPRGCAERSRSWPTYLRLPRSFSWNSRGLVPRQSTCWSGKPLFKTHSFQSGASMAAGLLRQSLRASR